MDDPNRFVGFDVEVERLDGSTIEGTIGDVDAAHKKMKLVNAKDSNGRDFRAFWIAGSRIRSLKLAIEKQIENLAISNLAGNYIQAYHDEPLNTETPESNNKGYDLLRKLKFPTGQVEDSIEAVDSLPSVQNVGIYGAANVSRQELEHNGRDAAIPEISSGNLRRQKGTNKKHNKESTWQGEDIGKIKDEEFDFEANLGLFDKAKVFDEIRKLDNKPEADLLVSHNRRKNFAFNENVLRENEDYSASEKREHISTLHTSGPEFNEPLLNRTQKNLINSNRPNTHDPSSSFKGKESRMESSDKTPSIRNRIAINGRKDGCLMFSSPKEACPVISKENFDQILELCITMFRSSAECIQENAARTISEKVNDMVQSDAQIRRIATSYIVVLAGYHQTGATAIVTARILSSLGYRVLLVVSNNDCHDEKIKEQLKYCRSFGVRITEDVYAATAGLSSRPQIIVDGLLGSDMTLADIWDTDELQRVVNIINYANQQVCPKISIDICSGLSGSEGDVSKPLLDVQIEPDTFVHSETIMAIGLPRVGLLQGLIKGKISREAELVVLNVGLPWKKVMKLIPDFKIINLKPSAFFGSFSRKIEYHGL